MPINKSQVSKILGLDLTGIPLDQRGDAKTDVMNFLKEQMLDDLARGKSPVTGDDFKPLSKGYAKAKAKQSSAPIPNMELTGAMLDALTVIDKGGNKIEIGWFDADQAVKAFNHTTGDTVPKRPLIPKTGQDFEPNIMDGIQNILDGYKGDEENPN